MLHVETATTATATRNLHTRQVSLALTLRSPSPLTAPSTLDTTKYSSSWKKL